MSEKITSWGTALSAIIAVIAFIFSLYSDNKKDNLGEIEKWKTVEVYTTLLTKGESTFQELKTSYVVSAQQLDLFELPKEDMQDISLRKILLELQEKNLVIFTENSKYKVSRTSWQPGNSDIMDLIKKEQEKKDFYPKIRVSILNVLDDNKCGTLSKNDLYQKVTKELEKEIDFSLFFDILSTMRGQEVHKLDDGTWCNTYDSEKSK